MQVQEPAGPVVTAIVTRKKEGEKGEGWRGEKGRIIIHISSRPISFSSFIITMPPPIRPTFYFPPDRYPKLLTLTLILHILIKGLDGETEFRAHARISRLRCMLLSTATAA